MTNRELFIKCYNAYLDFEQSLETLRSVGVQADESMFNNAFYTIFDSVMNNVLTEEGQDHLYEDILFQEYPLEEALEALEDYFV